MLCERLQKNVQKTGGLLFKKQYPCGKCKSCRITKRQEWTGRILLESSRFASNLFVTLTYAPEYLPPNGSLEKRDIQLFLKRLRKSLRTRIRYLAVGEYGSRRDRPHYHLVIFGADSISLEQIIEKGKVLTVSPQIKKAWPWGFHTADPLNRERARYVAGYCLKKMQDLEIHELERIVATTTDSKRRQKALDCLKIEQKRLGGERGIRTPEFMICSRGDGKKGSPNRYGIGLNEDCLKGTAQALARYKINPVDEHMYRIDGKLWPMGRSVRAKILKYSGMQDERTPVTKALKEHNRVNQDYNNPDATKEKQNKSISKARKVYEERDLREQL